MDFRIGKNDFLRGLKLAHGIADRKSTMPILANVLLRTVGSKSISLAATDLGIALSATLPATVETEGALTVSAKVLHDLVADVPGDEVRVKRAENLWAEISSGTFESKLVGMSDRDFPKLPDLGTIQFSRFDAPKLREMIEKTSFSVSHDETRFQLAGVFFECTGKRAKMVSTDGHRLTKYEMDISEGPTFERGIIVPRKGLADIRRATENVGGACDLAVSGGYLIIRVADVVLSVKLIEAEYPPYGQLIPKPAAEPVIASREQLIAALKRASLMASDKTSGIRIALSKGKMTLASDNPELGEARETLPVDYNGKELTIGFNGIYLRELLTNVPGPDVRMDLTGDLEPGVFRALGDVDYLGIVMPMRI